MQFLIVQALKKGTFTPIEEAASILIDGEKNGQTNDITILDEGTLDISVDLPGAEEVTIDLEDTTQTSPMQVTIEVD